MIAGQHVPWNTTIELDYNKSQSELRYDFWGRRVHFCYFPIIRGQDKDKTIRKHQYFWVRILELQFAMDHRVAKKDFDWYEKRKNVRVLWLVIWILGAETQKSKGKKMQLGILQISMLLNQL